MSWAWDGRWSRTDAGRSILMWYGMGFPESSDEGLPVRTDLPRPLLTNGRISKGLPPDGRPASAFPTDTRLFAYCGHAPLRREVRPNFRYLRRRVRAR